MTQVFSLPGLIKRLFSASGCIGRREYIFTNLGAVFGLIAFGMPFALWFNYELNLPSQTGQCPFGRGFHHSYRGYPQ